MNIYILSAVDCFHHFLWVFEQHKAGVIITHFAIIKLLVRSKTVRGMSQQADLSRELKRTASLVKSASNLSAHRLNNIYIC